MRITKISRFFRQRRLRKIAALVRAGKVPKNVTEADVFEALSLKKTHHMEAYGLLSCRVFDKHGVLKQDLGLVGVREVTAAFVKHLVDGLMTSDVSPSVDHFHHHAMGDGSTAETDTQTALVNQIDGVSAGSQTHGATSNIYKTIATIVASSAYTAIEHGVFNTTGDLMVDRTLVASPPTVATSDEVEWTYNLTVNYGG